MITALILGPLMGLLAVVLWRHRAAEITIAATVANTVFTAALARGILRSGEVEMAWWGLLKADGLSALFIGTTTCTGLVIALHAKGHRQPHGNGPIPPGFWPSWLVLLTGLNTIFLSEHLLAMFIGVELVGGAAVGMVVLSGSRRALVLARRYFLIRLPGSLLFLFAIAWLHAVYGTLFMGELRELLEPSAMTSWAAVLLLFGLLVKAAVFPLHYWLPAVHAIAVGSAGAVLSGLVVKGPFFAVVRIWFDLLPTVATQAAAAFIGALGAAGILWGAVHALRERRLKLIIAHSTVSQMGYLLILIPLLTGYAGSSWAAAAWTGGIYQAMAHATAKAALLMGAGVIVYSLGSDKLRNMHGLAGHLPLTTLAITLACVSLIGLPPSGGFIGKWLLLSAALQSGQWWWAPVLLAGSLLTAAYAFLILSYAFQAKVGFATVRKPPVLMEATVLALAAASVLMGLRVSEPMQLLGQTDEVRMEWNPEEGAP